jgi:hypothetical protein
LRGGGDQAVDDRVVVRRTDWHEQQRYSCKERAESIVGS